MGEEDGYREASSTSKHTLHVERTRVCRTWPAHTHMSSRRCCHHRISLLRSSTGETGLCDDAYTQGRKEWSFWGPLKWSRHDRCSVCYCSDACQYEANMEADNVSSLPTFLSLGVLLEVLLDSKGWAGDFDTIYSPIRVIETLLNGNATSLPVCLSHSYIRHVDSRPVCTSMPGSEPSPVNSTEITGLSNHRIMASRCSGSRPSPKPLETLGSGSTDQGHLPTKTGALDHTNT